jgi:hypothetical protein
MLQDVQPDAGEIGMIALDITTQYGGQRNTHIFVVHGVSEAGEFDVVHDKTLLKRILFAAFT